MGNNVDGALGNYSAFRQGNQPMQPWNRPMPRSWSNARRQSRGIQNANAKTTGQGWYNPEIAGMGSMYNPETHRRRLEQHFANMPGGENRRTVARPGITERRSAREAGISPHAMNDQRAREYLERQGASQEHLAHSLRARNRIRGTTPAPAGMPEADAAKWEAGQRAHALLKAKLRRAGR
jgi:hypothetical protein